MADIKSMTRRVLPRPSSSRQVGQSASTSHAMLPAPLYVQLVSLFRRRIGSGEWVIGKQIPTLDELAVDLGVARLTVRHAIGFLEAEGLIGRYRGRGTFVLKKPEQEVFLDIPTNWLDLVSGTAATAMEWLVCRTASVPPEPSHPAVGLRPSISCCIGSTGAARSPTSSPGHSWRRAC